MNVNYSPTMPASNIKAGSKMILNYLIKELTDEEIKALWEKSEQYNNDEPSTQFINDHKYSYYSISIGCGQWNYGGIVNAIIRDKYKNDEMEAITNNVTNIVSEFFRVLVTDGIISATKYLAQTFNASDTESFMQMQSWRVIAKQEAKKVLNIN